MPCMDDGRAAHEAHKALERMQDKLSRLTRILCGVCENVESRGNAVRGLSGPLWTWWEDHKKEDKARVTEEKHSKNLRTSELRRRIELLESELKQL